MHDGTSLHIMRCDAPIEHHAKAHHGRFAQAGIACRDARENVLPVCKSLAPATLRRSMQRRNSSAWQIFSKNLSFRWLSAGNGQHRQTSVEDQTAQFQRQQARIL